MEWIIVGIVLLGIGYSVASVRQVNDPNFFIVRRLGDIVRTQTGFGFIWAIIEEAIEITAQTVLVKVAPEDVYTQDRVHVKPKFSFEAVVSSAMNAHESHLFLLAGKLEGIQLKAEALLREIVLKEIKKYKFLELFKPDDTLAEDQRAMNRLDRAVTREFSHRCRILYGIPIRNFNLEDIEPADKDMVQLLQDPERYRLEVQKQGERALAEAARGKADGEYHRNVMTGEAARETALEAVRTQALSQRAAAVKDVGPWNALAAAGVGMADSIGKAIEKRGSNSGGKKKKGGKS